MLDKKILFVDLIEKTFEINFIERHKISLKEIIKSSYSILLYIQKKFLFKSYNRKNYIINKWRNKILSSNCNSCFY